jgi:hypothetical protein
MAGRAQAANDHRSESAVEIVSQQATLAPDGQSMSFGIATTCDRYLVNAYFMSVGDICRYLVTGV